MGKGRMTVLDLCATTKELRKQLIGSRLANVYDLNPKTFLWKFAKSEEKLFLLMESGIRVHFTKYSREKSDMPNGFCMKLRKHLRTKLLHDVQQMGMDRVVFFTFGTGEHAFHVILELYAAGNIILTDHTFTILSLLRPYELEDDGVRVVVGEKYPVHVGNDMNSLDAAKLTELWTKALENPKNKVISDIFPPGSSFSPVVVDHCLSEAGLEPKTPLRLLWNGQGAFASSERVVAALAPAMQLLESIMQQPMKGYLLGQPPKQDAAADAKKQQQGAAGGSKFQLSNQTKAARAAEEAAKQSSSSSSTSSSSSSSAASSLSADASDAKTDAPAAAEAAKKAEEDVNYTEFIPFAFASYSAQAAQGLLREFGSFNEAVDEFFTRVEASKESARLAAQEAAAWGKVERIREDHLIRVEQLEVQQQSLERQANLISAYHQQVDQAMLAVRQALAAGMDWQALGALIAEERKQGNPVAQCIHTLKLDANRIVLRLPNLLPGEEEEEEDEDEEEDEERDEDDEEEDESEDDDSDDDGRRKKKNKKKSKGKEKQKQKGKGKGAQQGKGGKGGKPPLVSVEVDLSLTAFANAEALFGNKKRSADKQQRTQAATNKALKHAEQTTRKTLQSLEQKAKIAKLRKVYWFEKFHWFITSENYLVVGGRDAQQNEQLVKRYLKKNDVYIHADIHGASSVIVKNSGDGPIPPLSLQQAALMTISRSSAWESKILTTAYWVQAHQVSKTAPTGEYLGTGSFMIRGKRNLIPPAPLVMGLALLFKVDDSTLAPHVGERRIRGFGDAASSVASEAADPRELDDIEAAMAAVPPTIPEEAELELDQAAAAPAPSSSSSAAAIDGDDDDNDNQGDGGASPFDDGSMPATPAPTRHASVALPASATAAGAEQVALALSDAARQLQADQQEQQQQEEDGDDDENDEDNEDDSAPSTGFDVTSALFQAASSMPSVFNLGLFARTPSTASLASSSSAATASSSTSAKFADVVSSITGGSAQERAEARAMAVASTWNPDGDEDEEDEDDPFAKKQNPNTSRRRLTAAQRRQLKKHGGLPSSSPDSDGKDEESKEESKEAAQPEPESNKDAKQNNGGKKGKETPAPQPVASLPRGKRSKARRNKGKYDDQDDDERELVAKLLGANISKKDDDSDDSDGNSDDDADDRKSNSKGKAAAAKGGKATQNKPQEKKDAGKGTSKGQTKDEQDSQKKAPVAEKDAGDDKTAEFLTRSCFICHQKGHVSRDCPQKPTDKSVKEAIAEAKQREEADVSRILAEENINFVSEEDRSALTEIDALTGRPLPTDILHFAIPVCAPWAALTDYKYKCKLVPGSSKRGQVAKGCMHAFTHHEETNAREKELIKVVPENDIFTVLLSNVKLASALARAGATKDKKKKR